MDLNQKQLETVNFYEKNQMQELKKLCYPLIVRKGVPSMDWDDLYSLASATLLESVLSYDENKGTKFNVFLSGNIKKAFYDWTRDKRRGKRCNLLRVNGKIVRDENDDVVVIPDISFDAPSEDGLDLCEKIPSNFDVEAELSIFAGNVDERVQLFLDTLPKVQREIIELKMKGIAVGDIKKQLKLTNNKYEDYMKAIKENQSIRTLFKSNKGTNNKQHGEGVKVMELNNNLEVCDNVMDIDTTDSYRRDTCPLGFLLDEKACGNLDCGYVSQRAPFQWDEKQINKYYSRILNNQPIPEIVVCETNVEGEKVSYLVEGLQRLSYAEEFRDNRIPVRSKGAEYTKIKYKKYSYDSSGKKILDENGRAKFIIEIFDITNKYYRDLPEFLRKRFDNYNFIVTRYFNCTYDIIDYHIRNYNNHVSMTAAHYGITSVSNKTSHKIKEISQKHPFFLNVVKCSNKKRKQGALEEMVARSIMSTFFINNWKKDLIEALKYVDENATDDQYINFKDSLNRINGIVNDLNQDLFNLTNGHIWIAIFNEFKALNLDDVLFKDFTMEFKKSLHSKIIKGRSYDEINTRNTKDKTVVKNKIDVLIDLMLDYFHVNKTESPSSEQFISDTTQINMEVVQENMEFYNALLDDLKKNSIRDDSTLNDPKYRLALLAVVAYACDNDLDLDDWMLKFADSQNKVMSNNNKENYLHMISDFREYISKSKQIGA